MTLPETMNAMVLTGHGGLDRYEWHEDWPVPTPGPTEAVIRVLACGLNNTDVNTRVGWYSKAVSEETSDDATGAAEDSSWGGKPLTFPRIQGADAVGLVVAVGSEGPEHLLGKRVIVDTWLRDWDAPGAPGWGYFGSECDGGFAQYAKVDARNLHPVDSPLTDAELATFPCSYITAEGMLTRAAVGEADTVLVPGASGGVGGALVQLARRRGARVIAMASPEKHEAVAELGPDLLLPRAPADLRAALGNEKVTVVADIVGGPAWPALIDVLEPGGRYTCSGAIAGPMVELDLRTLYLRDLSFFGSTVTPPGIVEAIVGYVERGEIRPVLARTFPLHALATAQAEFLSKKHTGNIVVIP